MRTSAIIAAITLASAVVPAVSPREEAVNDVSLINLIATPERYDGQMVRVAGFLRYRFEHQAIYLSKADAERGMFRNALWASFADAVVIEAPYRRRAPAAVGDLDGEYVSVQGRFNARAGGHMGLWPGSIEQISRVSIQPRLHE